jgi:GAF domain-containing protein
VRSDVSVPLRTADGTNVGTLCAWDLVARELDAEELARLEDLADQLVARVQLTRLALELGHAASHDPLTGAVNRLAQGFARAATAARCRSGTSTSTAERLVDATRAEETVARTGGFD